MIKATNISAGYDKKQVLFDVSFSVNSGESLSIIGPNGSGKTTLLKVIDNLIAFEGNVLIDDLPVKKIKRRELAKKVGLFSQTTDVYFNFSVYDTVMMGRYAYSDNSFFSPVSEQDKACVESALDAVNISSLRDREIDTLSGGQLQRVFLAKVLAQDPQYILLDEPTNHLDIGYQVEFITFLKKWSKENNKTIIGVLHDINLAMLLADNMLLLENGKVTMHGSADEILNSGALDKAYNMNIYEFMKSSFERFKR